MALQARALSSATLLAGRRSAAGAQRGLSLTAPLVSPARCYSRRAVKPIVAAAAGSSSSDKDAQLAAAWQRNSTLLSASGSLGLSQEAPLHVMYLSQTSEGAAAAPGLLTFPLSPDSSSSALQQLVAAAAPSPFGKGKETVFDPAVRTAAELKAAQLGLNKTLLPPEVLEQVRALLQPNASSVVAELDKLNVYGPGGFFKPHYDTPRAQDHFGTLIVCLPSPFKGGQLVLRHVDHNSSAAPPTRTYDWGAQDTQGLQWAAFYTDTEHEVLPVTEGYRITLTYNLRAVQKQPWPAPFTEPAAKAASEGHPEGEGEAAPSANGQPADNGTGSSREWMTPGDVSSSAELAADLQGLLADEEWHAQGERLGFILQHKYCAGLADLASLSFPEALKGPDRVLAAALAQAGLQPRVVPLFRGWTGYEDEDSYQDYLADDDYSDDEEEEEEAAEEEEDEAAATPINFGRPLQPAQQREPLTTEPGAYWGLMVAKFSDCTDSIDTGYGCYVNETEHKETLENVFGVEEQDICWVTPVLDKHFTYHGEVLAGANTHYAVWFYATAALLVDVPSWADRQAGKSAPASTAA